MSVQDNIAYGVNTNLLQADRYEAKYDFSGSTEIELPLKKGDIVSVIERAENGWWRGVCDGRVGWFPETYIKPLPRETHYDVPRVASPPRMSEMMGEGAEELEASGERA